MKKKNVNMNPCNKDFWIRGIFMILMLSIQIPATYAQSDDTDSLLYNHLKSFAKGNNHKRYNYIKKSVSDSNLVVKSEGIDWLGIHRNLVVEKQGKCDSVIYIICHYDKVDGNIFYLVNLLINGSLDFLLSNTYLSKGAYDNGTGTVVSLSLLSWIKDQDMNYTYRFLFAGMEEYGLRGSRRHVSGVKKSEWNKNLYAINIDMVGGIGQSAIVVSQNVSNPYLVDISEKIALENSHTLIKARMPLGALSDYAPFTGQSFFKDFSKSLLMNMVGAFIPQRSYFTQNKKGIPVINFTDNIDMGLTESLSSFSPVSFGKIHSFKDRPDKVEPSNLSMYYNFMKDFILYLDNQKAKEE